MGELIPLKITDSDSKPMVNEQFLTFFMIDQIIYKFKDINIPHRLIKKCTFNWVHLLFI